MNYRDAKAGLDWWQRYFAWKDKHMEELTGGQRPKDEPDVKVLRTLLFAEGGKGKSMAALTYPPPFTIVNLDKPMGNLLEQLPKTHAIRYIRIAFDDVDELTTQMAKQYLAVVNSAIREALKLGRGTLFIDGGHNLHEAVKIALLPKTDASPREYASVNAWWDTHFRRLAPKPINWVITSYAKPEWLSASKESGKMLPEGWKWTKSWMEQALFMYTKADVKPSETPPDRAEGMPQEFRGQITEAKENKSLIGRTLPRVTYRALFKLYYGELPPNHEELWVPNYK